MKQIINRMQKPTPAYFKKVSNIGLTMAAVSASILASPVALPVLVIKVASYLAVAGGVMTTISQSAVKMEKK